MVELLQALAGAEGLIVAVSAIVLATRGHRRPATWPLAACLGCFSLYLLVFAAAPLLGRLIQTLSTLLLTLPFLMTGLLLAFAIAYPDWQLKPAKVAAIVAALLPALAVVVLAVAAPGVMFEADGTTRAAYLTAENTFHAAVYLVAGAILLRKWHQAPAGLYRSQFLFVLLPFLLWNVDDGALILFATQNPDLLGQTPGPALIALAAAMLVLPLVVIALSLRRAAQSVPDERQQDRRLVIGTLLLSPLALLQLMGHELHLLVDGLVLPLLFYGVAKYQVLDIDVKIKTGIRRGSLGAVAVMIMLIIQQLIEQFAGSTLGIVGGAVVAGVALFAINPLHNAATKISDKAMPNVSATDTYLTYRRLELYRVALEGTLKDGMVDLREAKALQGLRTELRITEQEHTYLERDVRERLGGPHLTPVAAQA